MNNEKDINKTNNPILRVAAVQLESKPGDKPANLTRMESFIENASGRGVKIILFPECCITGYWYIRHLQKDDLEDLSEPVPGGDSSQQIINLAKKHEMAIGAGLIEKDQDGSYYNSYIIAMPDGSTHCHRKLHAFINPLVKSGSEYTIFDTPWGFRAGVLTCYDNNIGENSRIMALLGADIILAPHQTGGCRGSDPNKMGVIDRSLWDNRLNNPEAIEQELRGDKGRGWLMRWLPSRAHDNGVFLVFANGVGVDDDEIRTGNAMILDPYGRILTETWKADDDMVVADLDYSLLEKSTGRGWIKARRPELYSLLAKRTGIERDTRDIKFEK